MRWLRILAALAIILSIVRVDSRATESEGANTTPTLSYAALVERVSPAIVSVYAMAAQEGGARTQRSKGQPEPIFSFGSGVILDASGLVATANHGLEGDVVIKIALADKREFDAEIVLTDRRTDLALLRMKGAQDLPTVQLGNSDEVRAGDLVIAIGNPYAVGQTVTHGVVSAVGRTGLQLNNYEYYIQTDAAINPGSSGGALLDSRGRLIGINAAIFSQTRGWQGIGFAVPANMVAFVLASARKGDSVVRRPWLGARLVPLDRSSAARVGVPRRAGALVKTVIPDGPAAQGGLQADDVISSIEGKPIEDPNAFDYRFTMKGIPGRARLGVLRKGVEIEVDVSLAPAPETIPRQSTRIQKPLPLQGATVANLSPALAEELGLDEDAEGVAVTNVGKDTPAQQFGFQRGDILLKANGVKIGRVGDLERLLRTGRVATLEFDRDGDIFSTHINR